MDASQQMVLEHGCPFATYRKGPARLTEAVSGELDADIRTRNVKTPPENAGAPGDAGLDEILGRLTKGGSLVNWTSLKLQQVLSEGHNQEGGKAGHRQKTLQCGYQAELPEPTDQNTPQKPHPSALPTL